MTISRLSDGARLSVGNRAPSLDLATLAKLLARAIPPAQSADANALSARPLFSHNYTQIRVNTRSVISRLLADPDFKTAFAPGDGSGFLRDAPLPPSGTTAKLGGRLLPGTEVATAKAVKSLHAAIVNALNSSVSDFDWTALTANSMDDALKTMATSVGVSIRPPSPHARMQPVEFADTHRPQHERERDIGRVLSAIERVDGRDWLELMLSGMENALRDEDEDPELIDFITDTIRTQCKRPGSQMLRFLAFLEDEALARVRLQVCMHIMDVVAAHSNSAGFKSYVQRVREAFAAFAGQDGEPLTLDISAVYGVANNTDLTEHLRKAMFYGCLPVWCEAAVQLFESRPEPDSLQPTLREVSYRFRVNGLNPQTGSTAFASRLDSLKERLLNTPGPNENVKRSLAELVFLSLVLPPSFHEAASDDLRTQAAEIALALHADPVREIQRLHSELYARAALANQLAQELVQVLRSKSKTLITNANRFVNKLYVSVQDDIVDWSVLRGLSSEREDVLVKPESGPDTLAWFSRIRVSPDPWPASIASMWVETHLEERALTVAGDSQTVKMHKDLSTPVLPVRWIPYQLNKNTQQWIPDVPNSKVFSAGRGVVIDYYLRVLTQQLKQDDEKAQAEQFRAATVAAITLIIYLTLFEIARKAQTVCPQLTMTLMRLQKMGQIKHNREADARDGNTAIYAISQAVEKALARELTVKLQGFITEQSDNLGYKYSSVLAALQAGQPLCVQREGNLEKVALISYVTRPCDTHPSYPDADGYLFISRTYFANSLNDLTTIQVDRMLSRIVENRKDFTIPTLILEEIARLQELGYQHIILLSHHFGNRRLGRAAERHAPHASAQFFNEAARQFPDVYLYPLRRDVFAAIRLRQRANHESAFEVLHYEAHQNMYQDSAAAVLSSQLPIYTFATLHVVGDKPTEPKPQSGFCTYFLDTKYRVSDLKLAAVTQANILGIGEAQETRRSLISLLRAIHFMESEKSTAKNQPLQPVLDPFAWATPTRTAAAGELEVVSRRHRGSILLSLPALLAHVTPILHAKDKHDENDA